MAIGQSYVADFDSVSLPLKNAFHSILNRSSQERVPSSLSLNERAFFYELMRRLANAKLYVQANANDQELNNFSRKKAKSYKLLGQEELVVKIWNIIVDQLDECVDDVMANLIESFALESNLEMAFVRLWPQYCSGVFKNRTQILIDACQIFTEEFKFVFDAYPGVSSLQQFADYRLVEAAISVLGSRAEQTLTAVLHQLRALLLNQNKEAAKLETTYAESLKTILRVLSRCGLDLSPHTRFSLRKFYIQDLKSLLSSKIQFDEDYIGKLKEVLMTEYLIAGCISDRLPFEAKKLILETYLFKSGGLERLLELYGLRREFSAHFDTLKFAYRSANKCEEFYETFANVISAHFRASYKKKGDIDDILLTCSNIYSIGDQRCHRLIKGSLKLTVGGELNLLEPMSKSLDSKAKNWYRLIQGERVISHTVIEDEKASVQAIWTILHDFDLTEPFFKLYYERFLFRRVLLMGMKYLKYMNHPDNVEKILIDLLELRQTSWEFLPQLKGLRSNLTETKNINDRFHSETTEHIMLVPMIFERKNVPSAFQDQSLGDLNISKPLQALWNNFTEFYARSEPKADKKLLTLQNTLHHLEVETDFKLDDGSYLVLELTLLQTSILELFNEHKELSSLEISSYLNVSGATLEVALESFIEVGLLETSEEKLSINERFHPDKRKVRNGHLRIVHRPNSKSSIQAKEHRTSEDVAIVGTNSAWIKDILRASIVRCLKSAACPLSFVDLNRTVSENHSGFSLGEFKTALSECVDFYSLHNGLYQYKA